MGNQPQLAAFRVGATASRGASNDQLLNRRSQEVKFRRVDGGAQQAAFRLSDIVLAAISFQCVLATLL